MRIFRQGDILIIASSEVPEGQEVSREGGRVVLAHGEVTGHAHAIEQAGVRMIEGTRSRVLTADAPFELAHEEHHALVLPAGVYEVRRQREYSPLAIRNIAD